MRAIVMLLLLFSAANCFAEDPLEQLNTVEDTLSAMEHSLSVQAPDQAEGKAVRSLTDELSLEQQTYFVSDELLGARGWIRVQPCSPEGVISGAAAAPESPASQPGEGAARESYLWKSRPALPGDLHPGVLVISHDKGKDGGWYLAKITDISELGRGLVGVSAPFRAQLKSLRVIVN